MTFKPRSCAVKRVLAAIFFADAHTLRCVNGTIFGREVVPDVCNTNATSSGNAGPGCAGAAGARAEVSKVNEPAPRAGVGCNTRIDTPSLRATSIAGDFEPASTTSALACKSFK